MRPSSYITAMNSKEGRQEEQRLVLRRKRWISSQTEGEVRGIVDKIRGKKHETQHGGGSTGALRTAKSEVG